MSRKIINKIELMKVTEALLLEQGYGGFNFSALSKILNVGRSTLYEYYDSKDELIVDYMNGLMKAYKDELSIIVSNNDAEKKIIELIELMIKYSHIHHILKMIPLLQSNSAVVVTMKENFIADHIHIIHEIQSIIDYGKKEKVIKEAIPTNVLVNILFNTINKPSSLKIDDREWAQWIWEILYRGMSVT